MIFKPVLLEKVVDGTKTVTRRPANRMDADGNRVASHYNVGKIVKVQPGMGRVSVGSIRIVKMDLRRLDDITDADAKREGFTSRNGFIVYWSELYNGFDESMMVWRIEFELVEVTHTICDCCEGSGIKPVEQVGAGV